MGVAQIKESKSRNADLKIPAAVADYFGENKPREDLAQRSLRGGVISIVGKVVNAFVQIASVVFLARLLTPEDYGLVSMVSAMIGLAPIVTDLGTRDALVQQARITPGEVSTLFWITFATGCGFAAVVATSGPLVARFYGEPRLTAVALVSSLSIIPLSLSYQHQALLRRAMKYRESTLIEVGANVVGTTVAIAMAFRGWAYWSLVTRPVTSSVVAALGYWAACRWLPGRPTFTVGVKEMVKFGLHWAGFSVLDFIGSFADRIAIGHARGATNLGYYQKACLVYDNSLSLMTTPLHSVAMVGLSKLRNNLEKLWSSWAKALSTIAFFAMPAFGILAVISQDVVVLALGEKWANASILLSILALRGIPHVIERTVGWLHMAGGRADRFMRWGLISTTAQLIALFAGLPFGTQGVAWSYVVYTYVLFLPAIAYSGKPLGIGLGKVIRAVGPQMIGALASVVVGFLLRDTFFANTPMVLRTMLLVLSVSAAYVVIVVGLFRITTPLQVGHALFRACFAS
jgi:PST family polysaccharide transporter